MSLVYDLTKNKKYLTVLNFIKNKFIKGLKLEDDYLKQAQCFFVLSTGRVGTKTLSTILSKSPEILSFHEPTPKVFDLSKKAYLYDDKLNEDILSSSFALLREEHIKLSLFLGKKYLETSPQSTFMGPSIKGILPNTKFIHLVRNPVNIIKSGLNRGWYNGHPYDKFRIRPLEGTYYFEKWDDFSLVEKNIWLWTETNSWITSFLSKQNKNDKMIINSEDLFNNNKRTIIELFDFFSIEKIEKKVFEEVLAKKLNKNKKNEIKKINFSNLDKKLYEYFQLTKNKMGYLK